jgi:hypothetical protein
MSSHWNQLSIMCQGSREDKCVRWYIISFCILYLWSLKDQEWLGTIREACRLLVSTTTSPSTMWALLADVTVKALCSTKVFQVCLPCNCQIISWNACPHVCYMPAHDTSIVTAQSCDLSFHFIPRMKCGSEKNLNCWSWHCRHFYSLWKPMTYLLMFQK